MKIELKKYESKYAPKFLVELFDFKTLKSAGIFKGRFIKRFAKSLFTKSDKKMEEFMIVADGNIAGGLNLVKKADNSFEIGCIIFKKYRNRGIAEKAIKKLFALVQTKGIKKIVGITYKNNSVAIRLAKKLGYKKVKEDDREIHWERKLK